MDTYIYICIYIYNTCIYTYIYILTYIGLTRAPFDFRLVPRTSGIVDAPRPTRMHPLGLGLGVVLTGSL